MAAIEDRIRERLLKRNGPIPQTAAEDYDVSPEGQLYNKNFGLTDEQQIAENFIWNQDPDSFIPVVNPEGGDAAARQEAQQLMGANVRGSQKTLDEYKNLSPEAYTIDPSFYEAMNWSPDQRYQYETAEQQARTDTTGVDAQKAALGGYNDIYSSGGLTAIDRAAILESQAMREREMKGNQDAITRNAAEQGRGGSLLSGVLRGQAAQGTANMRALDDARMQALALTRRDSALAGMNTVGNQIQTAADAIDNFNTNMRADVQQRNAQQRNRGIDIGYDDERQTGRDNVDLRNKAEQLNKSAGFGARGKMADIANARQDQANNQAQYSNYLTGKDIQNVQRGQQKFENVLSGVGALTGSVSGPLASVLDRDEDEE